ncbi:MAG: TonB-dependent receptor [Pseudomonadota bacterium]
MSPITSLKSQLTALSAAVALPLIAQPSIAQNDGATLVEEIIVTAQRREQSLQDVSMSLSAFTADALEERVIEDVADLQFSVPNLIADSRRITIRGVGNNAGSSTAEDGLGYHINGIYINRPPVVSSEYFDIERIEVLRGPQGTLYGRNTTGGVLNIHTKKPHDEFGGQLTAQVGNYSAARVKGAINIPISSNINQRFAGFYHSRDGYNDNIVTGNSVDGRDSYQLRSSTAFEFGDNLTADIVVNYLNEDSDRASQTKGTCTKDAVTGCSALSAGFETPDVSGSIYQTLNNIFFGGTLLPAGDYFANSVNPNEFRTVNIDQEPTYEVEQLSVSLEFNYQFDNYRFTSLTGYVDSESDVFADFDRFATDVQLSAPVTFRANGRDFETSSNILSGRRDLAEADQFTQEIRLASQFDGGFNFMVGAFYFDEDRFGQVLITHPLLAATQQRLGLTPDFEWFNVESDPITTESIALFGEGYFDLNDSTTLTVGLRYTDDEKTIRTRQQFLVLVDPEWVDAEDNWQEVTGKLTLEHAINDDSMVFATISRGYKAGGLNPGGPMGGELFEPEFIDAIEIGSKNQFMDGRITANFGAFYYDYQDLQIGQVSETSAVTTNSDATIFGAEGEFAFTISEALQIDLAVSLLSAELDDFQSADEGDPLGIAPGTVQALDADGNPRFTGSGLVIKDVNGNKLNNSPEVSFKFGASYTFTMMEDFDLTARLDHFWQDEYFANGFNKPSDQIDSWSQTDVQLYITPQLANWTAKLYVKNALDNDDVIRRGQDGPLVGRFRSVNVLEPRTFGIEVSFNFE